MVIIDDGNALKKYYSRLLVGNFFYSFLVALMIVRKCHSCVKCATKKLVVRINSSGTLCHLSPDALKQLQMTRVTNNERGQDMEGFLPNTEGYVNTDCCHLGTNESLKVYHFVLKFD